MVIRISNYVQLSKKHKVFLCQILFISNYSVLCIYIYIYISNLENCEFFYIDFLSKLTNFYFIKFMFLVIFFWKIKKMTKKD